MPQPAAQPRTCALPATDPKAMEQLEPLLHVLRTNVRVSAPTAFPRGSLMPDGRLDLCKQGLGPEGAKAVAEALRENTSVSALLMGADAIGNDGAQAISDLIEHNRALTTVFLGCNQIDEVGARALARALAGNPSVKGLWLKRNALGGAGLLSLPRSARTRTCARSTSRKRA
jgi:hypothetical protein